MLYAIPNLPNSCITYARVRVKVATALIKKGFVIMARTKNITVNGIDISLQSVTFTWYSNLTDLYVNPANGRKNTAKYADALIKGCVTAPKELAQNGLKYFDEQDDLTTPGELVHEIENFLAERNQPNSGTKESAAK